jgi:hypothetical protein
VRQSQAVQKSLNHTCKFLEQHCLALHHWLACRAHQSGWWQTSSIKLGVPVAQLLTTSAANSTRKPVDASPELGRTRDAGEQCRLRGEAIPLCSHQCSQPMEQQDCHMLHLPMVQCFPGPALLCRL